MSTFKIYGVSTFNRKIEIQSATATGSATGSTVKVDQRLPAFGYNVRLPVEMAHLSPDAALEAFIAERTAERDALWHRIGVLNEQCEQARAMIGKSG